MQINFRHLILFFFIFVGFTIFLSSANKIILVNKKNFLTAEFNENKIVENKKKTSLVKKKKEVITTLNKPLNNYLEQYKEIFIKVKKGQTFSEILDNFNISNSKKF